MKYIAMFCVLAAMILGFGIVAAFILYLIAKVSEWLDSY